MNVAQALRALVILPLFCAAAAHADTPTAPLPHVRFYAEGIDAPLATFYEIIDLARECRRRFPEECGRSLKAAMKGGPLDLDPALLDLGSLHAATRARARAPGFSSTADARQLMGRLLARLDAQAREYDRRIYARAYAVYGACSKDRGDTGMLITIYHVDDQQFYGESRATYERDLDAMGTEGRQLEKLIDSQWPDSTCRKGLDLARRMMDAMHHKVEGVFVDDWKTPTPQERYGPVAMHIWEFAFELAREHEPAVGARVEAYERNRGK